jgi:3-hydroxy-9,10-secoandrosta-1,3,5(10)-triene-9,17-dione monooxygenase
MGYAERGEPIPMEKRAFFTYQSSNVVRRLADLVDDIVKLLGGRAIYMTSDIIQPWLDLHAGRAHVANDPSNRTADVIGTMLGEEPAFTFL